MEDNIHADMHGWLGGAWGCKVREGGVDKAPTYTSTGGAPVVGGASSRLGSRSTSSTCFERGSS